VIPCCNNCAYLYYAPPQWDQPFPEYTCWKKHWDGVEDPNTLLDLIECPDYL